MDNHRELKEDTDNSLPLKNMDDHGDTWCLWMYGGQC